MKCPDVGRKGGLGFKGLCACASRKEQAVLKGGRTCASFINGDLIADQQYGQGFQGWFSAVCYKAIEALC